MKQTVIGIFSDSSSAQDAVDRLIARGFDRDFVDMAHQGSGTTNIQSDAQGDSFGDRVSRFFSNMFDNEEESQRYSTRAQTGTTLSVHTDSMERAQLASEIMDECGAVDIDALSSDTTTMDSGTTTGMMSGISEVETSERSSDTERSIPVIEEELHVGKREVERGGVRIRSRIIEKPVEEHLRLREERVTVERTPVDRPATERDFQTLQEGEIQMRERAEVPVVNKEARVVEEVNLRKRTEEHEETVRDTVRSTDIDVENTIEDDDDRLTSR